MALGYSTVRVNVTALVVDGVDSDDLPDDTPLTGTLTLTPMVAEGSTILYDDAGTLKMKALTTLEVSIDSQGNINHRNRDYVKVVAPTPATTNMAELQWRATFSDLKYGSKSTRINPIYFYAVPDTEINLAEHVNVAPSSTAVQLSRGPRGFAVGEVISDGGDLVFRLDDQESTEVGRVALSPALLPPGGVDGQVLGLVGGQLAWVNSGAADVDGPLAQASLAYRTAALAAGTTRLKILTIGDSTNDGYGNPGGPDQWAKTWPLKLASLLREDFGLAAGGRGWIPPSTPLAPGNYIWRPATLLPNGYALDDLTTQVGIPGSLWLQRGHVSNVDEVTYTLSAGTTAVDIVTTGYGGNMTFTPATGSPVTLDSTGDRVVTRITNPGSTVNIHAASGVGFALLGVIEYVADSTAGVTQWNLSRGAMAAHEYAAWLAAGDKSLKPLIAAYAPHVALVCLGANDYQGGRTPSQLATALTAIHTDITAASADTEVVYLIRPLADDPEQTTTWTEYVETISTTAASLAAHVLDTRDLAGTGLYIADGVHFTDAGNTAMAQAAAAYMKVAG
ncbi:SGNH/GDSL hydrolase family protein [Rhodococcus sp. T2V]|uniref:SGNH/GDSL hydrolase family protein n=1 Tax=Rhodococcus sp. T2V TaxID=3034164 RepID=UPI0023E243CE|nr:SGNH/GDSL hydrolase family protein [Rhodococcus sp. T2V]MDF3308700.1 SGNH/GDSL hydrolase family protein [Rhodococcus sp. T2V]